MDLMSICLLLGINHDKEDLMLHIFQNLQKETLLKDLVEDDDEEEEEENDYNEEDNEDVEDGDGNSVKNKVEEANKTLYDDARSVISSNLNNNYEQEVNAGYNLRQFSLNFRDIEDSVRAFSGSGAIPIEHWLQEFDEMALLMGLNDFQKMIVAKKSLKGVAKLFVMSERGLNTWPKLRDALSNEFARKINSAQLHKMLTERQIKSNESLQEYLYCMKDLAAQGNIEESALIQHIIDGITDTHINKAMLYGAQSMNEFKIKLNTYETFTQKIKPEQGVSKKKYNNERLPQKKVFSENKQQPKVRCFKCGSIGHTSNNCNTGLKCFKCNKLGHFSRDCRSKNTEENPSGIHVVTNNERKELKLNNTMMKEIKILNRNCNALFDTGSGFNLITEELYKQIGKPVMMVSECTLKGFGNKSNVTKTIGQFNAKIEVDDHIFNLQFHVVNDDCMNIQMIIGKPICEQAEITINSNGIRINKLEEVEIMHIFKDKENEMIEIG